MRGIITTFNSAKGQGFIDKEIYFSYTAVCTQDYDLISEGIEVVYELSDNHAYGPIAVKIELVERWKNGISIK